MLSHSRNSTDSSSKICGKFCFSFIEESGSFGSAINFGISPLIALALLISEFLLQSPKGESGWISMSGQRHEGSFSCFC